MVLRMLMMLAAAAGLAACSTTNGTSFGLPKEALSAPRTDTLANFSTDLGVRQTAYVKAAQGAADGAQIFDVPTILAGTAGVGAAAFGLTNDLAPSAGTLAAGALGFRSYYHGTSRYPAYVGGARALSCLQHKAVLLGGQSYDPARTTWRDLALDPDMPEDLRPEAAATASLADSALARLATASMRVDTEVMNRLGAPAAPNLASMHQNYLDAIGRKNQQTEEVQEARTLAEGFVVKAKVKVDGVVPLSLKQVGAAERYAASLKRYDPLLKSIAGLDVEIEKCLALAG